MTASTKTMTSMSSSPAVTLATTSMSHAYGRGRARCGCQAAQGSPRFVVVTGGPGAGKTAILELARQRFCTHVRVLPEAATILFGGGFPRLDDALAARAAQRAIYRMQVELEAAALADAGAALVLCDRGTLDGLGYCGGAEDAFLDEVGTNKTRELARYATVIHMHTPPPEHYAGDSNNGIRIEDAALAAAIDTRLEKAWAGHTRLRGIDSTAEFLVKASAVLELLAQEVPACCRRTSSSG
jgi:predicted ATPase